MPYSTGWKQVPGPVHAPGEETPQKHLPGGGDRGADRPGQGETREFLLHVVVQEELIKGAMSFLSHRTDGSRGDTLGSPENTQGRTWGRSVYRASWLGAQRDTAGVVYTAFAHQQGGRRVRSRWTPGLSNGSAWKRPRP